MAAASATPGLSAESKANLKAQEQMAAESQAFQLAMANLQQEDAKKKSETDTKKALAASDRDAAKETARNLSK